ncbi:hypothetical protein N3K66_006382 [Trichothecium roseum]|uniref:Uncharacterized protein n=1 Tax=Trichothecium roseum TaxID=47278 RepID=A0ACC0UWI1_9HYPO|nr:hypothetical protein N3K66_006382 [Trichothecium roseum]
MSLITEIGHVALKPGFGGDAYKIDTQVGKALQLVIDSVLNFGAVAAHWAMSDEHPDRFNVFVDWHSVDEHNEYIKAPTFAAVQDALIPIIAGNSFIYHTETAVTSVFDDKAYPTVEVISLPFPADITEDRRKEVEKRFDECMDKALLKVGLCGKISRAWSLEKDVAVPGEDDKTCIMLTGLISWPSKQVHLENREKQEFKDNIHLLREMPQLIKLDVHHVDARSQYKK